MTSKTLRLAPEISPDCRCLVANRVRLISLSSFQIYSLIYTESLHVQHQSTCECRECTKFPSSFKVFFKADHSIIPDSTRPPALSSYSQHPQNGEKKVFDISSGAHYHNTQPTARLRRWSATEAKSKPTQTIHPQSLHKPKCQRGCP